MGVIFFVLNAVFATVILVMCLWASIWAIISKNPDTRYQPMRDDRGSFIRSQTNLGTDELDQLGATARGDPRLAVPAHKRMDLVDDDENSSASSTNVPSSAGAVPSFRPRASHEPEMSYRGNRPLSPMDSSTAMLPMGGRPYTSHNETPLAPGVRSQRPGTAPNPAQAAAAHAYRQQNTTSPWQKGVGY